MIRDDNKKCANSEREVGILLKAEVDENPTVERILQEETKILPGRPKIIRTGKPERPRKRFNTLTSVGNENLSVNYSHEQEEDDVFEDATANYAEVTMDEAINGENKEKWMDMIADEIRSLLKN